MVIMVAIVENSNFSGLYYNNIAHYLKSYAQYLISTEVLIYLIHFCFMKWQLIIKICGHQRLERCGSREEYFITNSRKMSYNYPRGSPVRMGLCFIPTHLGSRNDVGV